MFKKIKTQHVLKLFVLIAFVVLVVRFIDLDQVVVAMKNVGYSVFLLCLLLEVLFYLIDTYRVWVFSRKEYSFYVLFRSRMVSLFGGNFLPGLVSGDLLRIVLVCGKSISKIREFTLTVLASRLFGVSSLGFLIIIYAVGNSTQIPVYLLFMLLVLSLCLVFSSLLWQMRVIRKIALCLCSLLRIKSSLFRKIHYSFTHFSSKRIWSIGTGTSLITNLMCVAQFYIISEVITPELNFLDWCIQVPFIAFSAFLPIGFGAVGGQDVVMLGLANLQNISSESMIAVSLIMHAVRFTVSIFGMLFVVNIFKKPS